MPKANYFFLEWNKQNCLTILNNPKMIQEYSLLTHQYDAAMKLKFVRVKHFLYFELFDSMSDSLEQLSRK